MPRSCTLLKAGTTGTPTSTGASFTAFTVSVAALLSTDKVLAPPVLPLTVR